MIGSRVGPYEIAAKLGEGGMGEVYRATDTKLKREAQLLAQLHHPHIASILGLEEAGGVGALVLELVEGPTLGEMLEPGSLPLDESLAIAKQVADVDIRGHGAGVILGTAAYMSPEQAKGGAVDKRAASAELSGVAFGGIGGVGNAG